MSNHKDVPLPISIKLAYVHRSATELTSSDLVEVKHALKEVIEQASDALEDVRAEIRTRRAGHKEEERQAA